MSTNTVTLVVAGSALLGTVITAVAGIISVKVSNENKRKLDTPGEGTIGEKVQRALHK